MLKRGGQSGSRPGGLANSENPDGPTVKSEVLGKEEVSEEEAGDLIEGSGGAVVSPDGPGKGSDEPGKGEEVGNVSVGVEGSGGPGGPGKGEAVDMLCAEELVSEWMSLILMVVLGESEHRVIY